jgi:hypothetical protein
LYMTRNGVFQGLLQEEVFEGLLQYFGVYAAIRMVQRKGLDELLA